VEPLPSNLAIRTPPGTSTLNLGLNTDWNFIHQSAYFYMACYCVSELVSNSHILDTSNIKGFHFRGVSSGMQFSLRNAENQDLYTLNDTAVADGIAAVWEVVGYGEAARMYRDGELVDESAITTTDGDAGTNLYIGTNPEWEGGNYSRGFYGAVLWDQTPTEDQRAFWRSWLTYQS